MCQAVTGTWMHYCVDTPNNSRRKMILLFFTNEAIGTAGTRTSSWLSEDLLSLPRQGLRLPCAYHIPVQGSQRQRECMGGWRPTSKPWPF